MSDDDVGTFGTWDYVVLAGMLSISILIGVYHAFKAGKETSNKDFLLAGGNMHPIPVATSLVATFISAITVLGTPAEMYTYGAMYWLFALSFVTTGLFVARFTIPLFFRMTNCTSANEYLELRFNKAVRVCALLTFMVQMFLYMGIVIYAPALALNTVTGINLWGSVIATGLACTFYTSIGGMKAVLWTDVFQTIVMISGFLAVIIEGCRRLGGMDEMWRIAGEGGRLEFWDFDPDPTIRHTFWTIVVGGTFTWSYSYGVNQAQVQRYLSCGTQERATVALFLAICGMVVVVSLACLSGLTMYAFYAGCDPLQLGRVGQSDQLIVLFTLELFGHIPGLPGLFTSAVFSGALSSVSSGLNALSAVTTEDFVKQVWKDIPETRLAWISKGIAFFYGLIAILLAFVVSTMSGSVLTISLSLFGMLGGPLFGVFSLGMFFPWSNSKGAVTGIITGLALTCWIGIGATVYPPDTYKPPLSIAECEGYNFTSAAPPLSTLFPTTPEPLAGVTNLYTVSYIYYPAIGWATCIIVGLIVSFLTGHNKAEDLDPKLFISVADAMYCCFPESCKKVFRCGVPRYEDVHDGEKEDELEAIKMSGVGVYEVEKETKVALAGYENGAIQMEEKSTDTSDLRARQREEKL